MTTTSPTGVLRVVREAYLGKNPTVVEATKDLLRAKVARFQALRTLDELNEEKASRAVWVPPSSSRGSKHGTKSSVEDLASKLRASKTNARLQAGEVRRLSLKRAFVIWRAMNAVGGEMDRALESLEEDNAAKVEGRALTAWKEVVEPWRYEESVLESAELFRLLCQLGRQDRVIQYWRALVAKRKDMQARREVFEQHMARRILQDALVHWKVYRLVYHLKRARVYMAIEFDRLRRLKSAFVHLRGRASRRVRICERMEAAVFLGRRAQPTVDDLLNLGQSPLALKESYVVLDDHLRATMDVPGKLDIIGRLEAACAEMRPLVRWKEVVADVSLIRIKGRVDCVDVTEVGPGMERGDNRQPGQVTHPELSQEDPMEPIREALAICVQREDELRLEQQAVLVEMTKLSRSKLPRLQKNQDTAMINLSECEKVMTDLQGVRELLDRQMRTASDAVSKLEADHAEAAGVAEHLEGAHSAALTYLDAAKTQIVAHMDECRRTDEKIAHWQAMIDDLALRAADAVRAAVPGDKPARAGHGKNGRDITLSVKLDESRDRLRRAEERRHQLGASYEKLVTAQEEAMAAERHAKDNLSRARSAKDRANDALSGAKERHCCLADHHLDLEREYNGLVLCLERLLAAVDRSDAALAAAFERASELDTKYEMLEKSLESLSESRQRLEQELEAEAQRVAAEEAATNQVVPSLDGDAGEVDGNEETVSVTLWGNESCDFHLLGMTARRGKPMVPGDRLLLQATDSYHILSRVKSCLAHWKVLAAQKKTGREAADRAFTAKVAPSVFVAWQQHVREASETCGAWNERRIIATFMSAWRRTSHNLRRDDFLVESYRAVGAARLQERVLVAWKEVAEEELVCLHASRRMSLALRTKLFAYWRAKTARSTDLAVRLTPVRQKKETELTKASFDEWRRATAVRMALRNAFSSACAAWALRLRSEAYFDATNRVNILDDCVNAWSLVVHQARDDRRLAAIQEAVEISRCQRMLRITFAGLRRTSETQRRDRLELLQDAEERHRIATLNGAFSYLRSWTAHRAIRYTHLRMKWSYDDPLRTAIFAWQAAISRRQEMESRKLLCDKLRRVVRGTSFIEHPQPPETSSPIKSATYLVADVAELSFAESAHGATLAGPTERDEAQTTAISL